MRCSGPRSRAGSGARGCRRRWPRVAWRSRGPGKRSQLLPALHAIQERIGWISQPALNYVSRRLAVPPAEAYGVATFYALFATKPRPPVAAHVCDDIACRLAGADGSARPARAGRPGAGDAGRRGRLVAQPVPGPVRPRAGGACSRSPANSRASPAPRRSMPRGSSPPRLDEAEDLRRPPPVPPGDRRGPLPAPGPDRRRRSDARSTTIEPMAATGPWRAIEIGADAVIAEVTASKLVGRGGAAFPTGRKWAAVAAQPAQPHYLVCNADESSPARSRIASCSRATRSRSSSR